MNINLSWVGQSTIVLVICPTELVVEPEPTVYSLARQAGKGLHSKAKSHPVDRSSGYTGNRRAIGSTLWIHWNANILTHDQQSDTNLSEFPWQWYAIVFILCNLQLISYSDSSHFGVGRFGKPVSPYPYLALQVSYELILIFLVESNICWPRISCNQGIGINCSYSL